MTYIDSAIPDVDVSLDSLPSPPFVAMEIIRLTQDLDSSAADLAAVLSQDPVLATRILQVANSPAYGLAQPVSSVERATALLGLKAVKMMALSFSLADDLGEPTGALSVETYWYRSLLNAVAGRRWAELTAPGLTEEAFLAGLLSHLGRLVLAREKPGEFAKVLAVAGGSWPTQEAERQVFGFSSRDLTRVLLHNWGLPPIIVAALTPQSDQGQDEDGVNGASELAEVLRKVAVTETVLGGAATPELFAAFETDVQEAGLGHDQLEEFVLDLETRVRMMADMLGVGVPRDMSHQKILNEARSRLVAVSLEAAQNLQTVEHQAEQLRASNAELEDMAFLDRLTAIPNRAAFDDHLSRAIAGAARRELGSVGVLLFDIDHFKAFNDTYGHQLGDEVLRHVAAAMASVTRSDELLARYGGEEFALVAVDCTAADLFVTGERLRRAVEQLRVPSESGALTVTISAGAAVVPRGFDATAGEELIGAADDALYEAKENGRNQVRVSQ